MQYFAINALSLTLARGLSVGGRAWVLLLLAHSATPGMLATGTIMVTLAETGRAVFDMGVELWLVRAAAMTDDPIEANRAAAIALTLRVMTGVTASCAVMLIGISANLTVSAAAVASVLTLTGLVSGIPVALLQARGQLARVLVSMVPILGAGLILITLATQWAVPAQSLLLALAVLESVSVLATLVQCRLGPDVRWRTIGPQLRSVLRDCLPVALFNGLVGVYARLDVWLLAAFDVAALGPYSVAYRLYQPVSLILASIAGVCYAALSRALASSPNSRISVGRRLPVVVCVVGLALVGGFLAAGHWAIDHVFTRYPDAFVVVVVLGVLLPVSGCNGICTALLSSRGRFITLSKVAAFNLVVFTVALLALIPRHGAAGAATALLLGETCNLSVQLWLIRPHVRS